MNFARMEMLFFIWAVPAAALIFFFGMTKRRKIMESYACKKALKVIAPDLASAKRVIKAGLILMALFLMAIAMSGPRYGYKWQKIKQKGIDIIIALDCSKSMLAEDIKPNRLLRAKREVYDLLNMLKGDRIGLVAFSGTAFLQCPLTMDYEAFYVFLNSLGPDYLPVGGTDLFGAVMTAVSGFEKKANSEKAIILITDGESTGGKDPLEAAKAAKKAGVKLFCIGVGSESGVPVPDSGGGFKKDKDGKIIVTRLDADTLKKMALITGGTYVRSVSGDMDLDVIYSKEIRGKMKKATITSTRKKIWEDRYQWFLFIAFVFMAIEIFLSDRPGKKITAGLVILFMMMPPSLSNAALFRDNPAEKGAELYNKGQYEKALKSFIDAQLENPDDPKILYNLGNVYYKLKDWESARINYENALKTKDKGLKHKAFYNLGNASFKQGEYKKAIKYYEAALKIAPDDIDARQNIEFVKKIMRQKQNKKPENKNNKSQKKNKKDKDKHDDKGKKSRAGKNNDKNNSGNKNKEAKNRENQKENSPEYGNQMKEKKGTKERKNQPSPGKAGKKPDENQKNNMAKTKAGKQKSQKTNRSDMILNRLKDQPGRAMIPFYRKHEVEKDW